jgi:hypothetical protein
MKKSATYGKKKRTILGESQLNVTDSVFSQKSYLQSKYKSPFLESSSPTSVSSIDEKVNCNAKLGRSRQSENIDGLDSGSSDESFLDDQWTCNIKSNNSKSIKEHDIIRKSIICIESDDESVQVERTWKSTKQNSKSTLICPDSNDQGKLFLHLIIMKIKTYNVMENRILDEVNI